MLCEPAFGGICNAVVKYDDSTVIAGLTRNPQELGDAGIRRHDATNLLRLIYIASILFLASCDGMKTELDISSISFPPKLSVTAILDRCFSPDSSSFSSDSSSFSINIVEARSLADYAKPFSTDREIIRNGEIRLFEDDRLIWSKTGPFDMSTKIAFVSGDSWTGENKCGYHHIEYGISISAGSEYRLEVEIEGYETATSTSVIPEIPVVTASVDTSTKVLKSHVRNINSLNNTTGFSNGYYYMPISVHFTETDSNVRKYFALDIREKLDFHCNDGVCQNSRNQNYYGICVAELSKLQDNPDVEALDLLTNNTNNVADLYAFPFLLQSNLTFTNGINKLNYYMMNVFGKDTCLFGCLEANNPEFIKYSNYQTYLLRVKSITTETFRYYRGLVLQSKGMGFFSEPVTIVGNIKNGYGCFSVSNTVYVPLLVYEEYYYFTKTEVVGKRTRARWTKP